MGGRDIPSQSVSGPPCDSLPAWCASVCPNPVSVTMTCDLAPPPPGRDDLLCRDEEAEAHRAQNDMARKW